MFRKRNALAWGFFIGIIVCAAILLIGGTCVQAQNWQALPPYNLLWPLWSPALSPVNPITGIATPLINNLNQNTILPVQPVLALDPAFDLPYLLYNIPVAWGGGMTYFDPYFGLKPFPPDYLIDPLIGGPLPLTLPTGFASILPTPLLTTTLYYANLLYISQYPYLGLGVLNPITDLLTPGEIWGLTPLI